MTRATGNRNRARVLLEALEGREMLSAVPYVFHGAKIGVTAAERARIASLMTGAVGLTFGLTAASPSGLVFGKIPPDPLATFFSTASAANISVTIDWGDGSAATAGTVAALAAHAGTSRQYAVNGEHLYASAGTYQVKIHVTIRGSVGTVTQTIAATSDVSAPPVVVVSPFPPVNSNPFISGSNFNAVAGVEGDGITVANAYWALTNIMINWGDGSAPTPGTLEQYMTALNESQDLFVLNPNPFPLFAIVGNHTYATPGSYTVTITADHVTPIVTLAGASTTLTTHATTTATATVTQNSADGGNFVGTPGVPLQFQGGLVGLALTPLNEVSAAIDWGDGTVSPATLVSVGTDTTGEPLYAIAGSHTYAEAGSYRITTTAWIGPQSGGGSRIESSYSTALITTPVAETESLLQLTTSGGTTQLSTVVPVGELPGITVEGGISYGIGWSPDPSIHLTLISGPDIHYIATIDWGDGAVEPATFISPNEGPIFPLSGSISAGAILPFEPPNIGISGSHAYASGGTYDVTVTITELYTPATGVPDASVANFQGQAVVPAVTDVPVQVTANGSSAHVQASVPVLQLPASMLPTGGVISQLLPGAAVTFTATINWGDGTTSAAELSSPPLLLPIPVPPGVPPGTLVLQIPPVIVSGDHSYAADGVYNVMVTITASSISDGMSEVIGAETLLPGQVVIAQG